MRKYGKLREKIKSKFKTLGEFAKAIGMSQCTISFKLNGKVGWKQAEIEKICQLLDIPMAEIYEYFFYQ